MENIKHDDFKLYLALCPLLTIQDAHQILQAISKKQFINTNRQELFKLNFRSEIISDFINWQKKYCVDQIKKRLQLDKIKVLYSTDKLHLNIFKEIPYPPPFLFYKGDLNVLNKKNILYLAIVGSRDCTKYGEKVVSNLLRGLSLRIKIITVSGLAKGIDAQVHSESIKNNIPTIAVLGAGLFKERIYPKENTYLFDSIVKNGGLILSEFPPNSYPKKGNFPRRNRIISALSQAVLVIEAREKSGALITARFALEQNKEVLAVPGDIFSDESKGVNTLIQRGAYPIIDYEDIIKYFY